MASPASNSAQTDQYTPFLKLCWKAAIKWNSHPSRKEIELFAWSSWEGCGENPKAAETYLADSIQECGLSPVDNADYFGYPGGRWYVIIILLERQGMERPPEGWRVWIRKHPFEVNKLLATQFTMFLIAEPTEDMALRIWQHGHDWEDNKELKEATDIYIYQVHLIKKWLQKN